MTTEEKTRQKDKSYETETHEQLIYQTDYSTKSQTLKLGL